MINIVTPDLVISGGEDTPDAGTVGLITRDSTRLRQRKLLRSAVITGRDFFSLNFLFQVLF